LPYKPILNQFIISLYNCFFDLVYKFPLKIDDCLLK